VSLFRFVRGRKSQRRPVNLPARVPDGVRVYAFGDTHGRSDLLRSLLDAIQHDALGSSLQTVVVGLGDYVDRGPDSNGVLQVLADGIAGMEFVSVRGNHEQMMLDFLDSPEKSGALWLANGARETLASYGIETRPVPRPSAGDLRSLRDALAARVPPRHLMSLQRTQLSYISGDYLFVHAGVRRDVAATEQAAADLLWTRQSSADEDEPFEKVVVHGHTPVEEPFIGRYRINLDTGAQFTNRLSCLVLQGDSATLFQQA
jgi:serine/threonine protein phosphatase 1